MNHLPATYRSRDGDVLDAIAWRIYGNAHAVHALLDVNPQVAWHAPVLPAGVVLTLPPVPVLPPPVQTVRLW